MKHNWSPIANLVYVIRHKPALMVFTACIFTVGITALFSALYISREHIVIPNFDKRREWKSFLKHLSSNDLCLQESKSFPKYENGYETSFPADFYADPSKIGHAINVYGIIDISGFRACSMEIPKIVDISFSISKAKATNNQRTVCLTIHKLPKDFFPKFLEAPCTPELENKGKRWAFSSNTSGCDSSLLSNVNFANYANNYEIMDALAESDRNSIYLGLTWIGTISVCVTLVAFFYGILYKSRSVTTICDNY